jgi:hypothetical protein
MLLVIVHAGVPLLNLHQVRADAVGAQVPGSSAKTPICDFRGANDITIGHIHSQPASFYRRGFDGGEATNGVLGRG